MHMKFLCVVEVERDKNGDHDNDADLRWLDSVSQYFSLRNYESISKCLINVNYTFPNEFIPRFRVITKQTEQLELNAMQVSNEITM